MNPSRLLTYALRSRLLGAITCAAGRGLKSLQVKCKHAAYVAAHQCYSGGPVRGILKASDEAISTTTNAKSSIDSTSLKSLSVPMIDFKGFQKGKTVVAIAVSGGIDSAFTAYLMKKDGHNCVGVFMRNWDGSDEVGAEACTTTESDFQDAVEVCKSLDIPLFESNFTKDYWNQVFEPFLETYSSGIGTPNPDVFCNKYIKFNKLKEFVRNKWGSDAVLATGHYATLRSTCKLGVGSKDIALPGERLQYSQSLIAAADPLKDQSYFLCMTKGSDFDNVVFPMGIYKKQDVKVITTQIFNGLNVLKKKESMGICFIGKRSLRSFLGTYIDFSPGRFVDLETGAILGEHKGKELFTIGQIAKISGMKSKYYVAEKKSDSNDICIVPGHDHPLLYSSSIVVSFDDFSWISGRFPDNLLDLPDANERHLVRLYCRIKHRGSLLPCDISIINTEGCVDGNINATKKPSKGIKIRLIGLKAWAVSPGQILALYQPLQQQPLQQLQVISNGSAPFMDEFECLGGGVILYTSREI